MSDGLAQRPGGAADDDLPGGDVACDDGAGPDEGPLADRPPLQHDRARSDTRPGPQVHAPADPGAGEDGDEVVQDAVVPDRRAVLDVDVPADSDVAAHVRERHHDAAGADGRLRPDDGAGMDQRPGVQPEHVELSRQPGAHGWVGDADQVSAAGRGVAGRQDRQSANPGPGSALVQEACDVRFEGQGDVEDLAAGAAGTDDVEVHGRHPALPTRVDLLVLVLLAALGGWTAAAGGRPGPELALIAAVAGAFVLGRCAGSWRATRIAAAAAVAAAVTLAVLAAPDGLSGRPLAGPLGYGNANGALCTLGVTGLLLAVLTFRRTSVRLAGTVLAAGLVYAAHRTGSQAATALSSAVVGLAAVLAARPSWGRAVPLLTALAVAGGIAATVGLALVPRDAGSGGPVVEALSDRRVVLWSESLDLVRREPLLGVGADRFSAEAPTAAADADAGWAHSAWLQQAAETGLPGGLLLCAVGVTTVLATRRATRSRAWGASAAVGAAGVGAVLVQASIDYVLHFPAVAVLTALLIGLAVSVPCVSVHRRSRWSA